MLARQDHGAGPLQTGYTRRLTSSGQLLVTHAPTSVWLLPLLEQCAFSLSSSACTCPELSPPVEEF